jgi:hypothetical protein
MDSDSLREIVIITGSSSLMLSVITLALTISFFFRKIEEVERIIATPGKQLDGIKRVWGNGPLGRWFRAGHVWMFFAFRRIPFVGQRLEQRMGDEREPVPLHLKCWAIIPVTLFFLFGTIFLFSAWRLDLYQ